MPIEIVRTYGKRHVYRTDKTCENCTQFTECWNTRGNPSPVNFPANFRLRSNWDARDFLPYMYSIYGGICGHFIHTDPEIAARWILTEQAATARKAGGEWDG